MRNSRNWALVLCFVVFCGGIGRADSKAYYDFGADRPNTANPGLDDPEPLEYVPNEIIVKFRRNAADIIEMSLAEGVSASEQEISASLDKLNKRYKLKMARPLFKNFRENRQHLKALLKKDKTLLTKKERRILRRLKRAPKGAKVPELDRIYKLEIEPEAGQSLEDVVAAYNSDPDVEYAELNYIVSICQTPDDPLYPIQWPLNNMGQMYPESGRYNPPPGTPDCDIDAPEAWDIETGNPEIVVAVIDTGVDYTHRDIDDNMWVNTGEIGGNGIDDDGNGYIDDIYGWDYRNDDSDPKDDHGHGTHCGGIIAAEGDNALDIAGVCWDAKIMALKFLDSGGSGWISHAVSAFYSAVTNGADVMSNSWSGGCYLQSMRDAIDYAYSQGVIMVAAAGNDNSSSPVYPAYYNHMISVAATNSNDARATFSNYGSWVDIAAPGVDILSLRASGTSMGTTYDDFTTVASGTSMACPHVAGACALLLSVNSELTVDEVTDVLKQSADLIEAGICQSGRLNIYAALPATVKPKGTIQLDREAYSCSEVIGIKVKDSDLKGTVTQDVNVATDGGDFETVLLAEQETNIGIFVGSISTSTDPVVSEDGVLQVSHGQTLTATYEDANDGTGNPATAADDAIVDCEEAVVLDVNVTTGLIGRSVTIKIQTNEPTTALVRCGLVCGGPYTLEGKDIVMSTSHTIKLLSLTSETDYYFVIELADAAGNETVDDNYSGCYFFTTPEFLGFLVPSVYPTIQAAVDDSWDGDTVWVADGVYTGDGNRDIDFAGKAITVRSENGPEGCIIDCNGSEGDEHRGFYLHSGEELDSVIDGFTIINGYAYQGGAIRSDGYAHNPWVEYVSPTITNCIIRYCKASEGGGIYCKWGHPKIINCEVNDNPGGSGIYGHWVAWLIDNCLISNNSGYGIYNDDCDGTISNCTITANSAGIACNYWSNLTIRNCRITNHFGSGIYALFGESEGKIITVDDCIISHNSGSGISCNQAILHLNDSILMENFSWTKGGGLCCSWDGGATVKNCVFAGNQAKQKGGGIYSNDGHNTYVNCTIVNNTASEYGGGYYCQNSGNRKFTNCIFWGNSAGSGPQMAIGGGLSYVTISCCDVQGGQEQIFVDSYSPPLTWGTGNIDTDPYFGLVGDYHILSNSPCIDAGTNSPAGGLPSTDLYGSPRSLDGDGNGSSIADMGAYEVEYNSSTPIIAIDKEFFEFYNFSNKPNPEDQYLYISNCGGGTLNWEISDDSFWLEAIPNSGSSTGDINDITLRVDATILSHGEYTCTVTISDENAVNSPRTVQVKLHVAANIRVPENYPTIQEAIDAVGDNSTILVADGLYTGSGNKDIRFRGKAITVHSENGPDNCTIDCEDNGRGFIFTGHEENDSVLDGFTVIDGNSSDHGGGIYVNSSSPTITNCKVIDCRTTNIFGGGIYFERSGAKLSNCFISGNWSGLEGGGICIDDGTTVPLMIKNCIFTGNSAQDGAGLCARNDNGSYATIRNCLFFGNFGSAIYLTSTSTKIYNCTLVGNTGSGVHFKCTTNRTPVLKNSILWGNIFPQIYEEEYVIPAIYYNDIQGGHSGTGNINADPLFVTGPSGDYYLSQTSAGQGSNSPCVDSGSDTAVNLEMNEFTTRTDQTRDGGVVDMGYHYPRINIANIDGDGDVDFFDFAILASQWLDVPGIPSADIAPAAGDGIVDIYDLAIFVEHWQECYITQARNPNPADTAAGVALEVVLEWTPGKFAMLHDVYFGMSLEGVKNANIFSSEYQGRQSSNSWDSTNYDFDGLAVGATHYWRIDQVNANSIVAGTVWSFTTKDLSDFTAFNPCPTDTAYSVEPNDVVLSWSPGRFAISHDVYLGTNFNDVKDANTFSDEYIGNFDVNSYDAGNLDRDTVYYWRVDEICSGGTEVGDLWSFSTLGEPDFHLVGWWEFEEGTGTIAYDSSGNGNNGTLRGEPDWVSGKAGDYALEFDGLASDGFMDSVKLSPITALEGNLVTVAGWIYASDFETYNTVLAQYNGSYDGYSLYTYNNQPSFYIGGGSYLEAVSPEAINTGQWYHLAGTNDGSSLKIYVDGIPKAEVSSVGCSGVNYNAYIGCDSSYAFFNGIIDDVRVYNRALSGGEIWALYQAGL